MNGRRLPSLLSIGGSDPGGGAGIQADLRVFHHLGFHGLSAITAITSQNSHQVKEFWPLTPAQLASQLEAVLSDFQPAATKTGMLAAPELVEVVAGFARRGQLSALVIDPVLASSAGPPLAAHKEDLIAAIRDELLPRCAAVTPNLAEAAALAGHPVETLEDARRAAFTLVDALGAGGACITGGHLDGLPADVIYDGRCLEVLEGRRLGTGELHGTGCLYSAALAGSLAKGEELRAAALAAKALTEQAIGAAVRPGGGMSIPWIY